MDVTQEELRLSQKEEAELKDDLYQTKGQLQHEQADVVKPQRAMPTNQREKLAITERNRIGIRSLKAAAGECSERVAMPDSFWEILHWCSV